MHREGFVNTQEDKEINKNITTTTASKQIFIIIRVHS